MLAPGWHAVIEAEQSLQIEIAGKLARQFVDDDSTRHGMQEDVTQPARAKVICWSARPW
jgi:hypothetical protein